MDDVDNLTDLQVSYYDRDDEGFWIPKGNYTVKLRHGDMHTPLIETIHRALPEDLRWGAQESTNIFCYVNNFKGLKIDLSENPNQIPYIMVSLRTYTKPVLYVCRGSRHDSGVSISSSLSSDPDIRRPSTVVSRNFDDIGPPPTAIPDDEQIFNDDSEDQDPSDSDEDRDVFEVPFCATAKGNDKGTTLPHTALRHTHAHVSRPTATLPHPKTASMTTREQMSPLQRKPPMLRTVSETDIAGSSGQQVQLLSMRMINSFDDDRTYISHRAQGIAPRNLIGITAPHQPSPLSQPFDDRVAMRSSGLRQRRDAIKRRSTLDLNILQPPVNLESLQINAADAYGCDEFAVPCENYSTVREVKQAIAVELESKQMSQAKVDPSTLVLTYTSAGTEYELLDGSQFLLNTFLCKNLSSSQLVDAGPSTTVQQLKQLPDKELRVLYRISQLTGVLLERATTSLGIDTQDLAVIPAADQAEVQWARRTLHDCVMAAAATRDKEKYSLSVELETKTIHPGLYQKIPRENEVPVTFHYKDVFSLKKNVNVVKRDAESVLHEVFPCVVACGIKGVNDKVEDYTLQTTGECSYIHGKFQLINFKDIRRCILKGEPIHCSITKRPSPEVDKAHSFSWLPVDQLSNCSPSHSDVSSNAPIYRTRTDSVWENNKHFSFQLQTVENLIEKADQYVFVRASLCHGTEALPKQELITTKKMPLKNTIDWNEKLEFIVQMKYLPKATKLMIVVNEGRPGMDTRSLHWGLISVFNHRGIQRTGKQVMRLWPWKNKRNRKDGNQPEVKLSEREGKMITKLKPNPAGPAANNPDAKAVTITIWLEETGKAVFFPSTSEESRDVLFRQHPAVRKTGLKRVFRRQLEVMKDKGVYHRLPRFIEMVNWTDFSSLEVYSLLNKLEDVIDSIPIETALRLLDCDFPDGTVRAFATRVLSRVPDEQLEDFLLQLTQALKFEPNHDSALARFLLRRALTNKRIGHFFFWYLKCEMYNPQYTARFAVIMEAYLKACGESMLTKFMDQMEMQATLENIGKQLKESCDGDQTKMQELLPAKLESERVSKFVFTAVYNPRVMLGNLRASRCKILSSAKRPLWLEMQNVLPTALQQTPTRLILKLGDDLRQDMITLKMFSLFEKLWEEEGLDLCLIPYGCMATGPKTGFIEVVKNAKTIAEVSETNDNKKLYEWIKSHQINEYGEVDSDKLEAAVDTFVRSCAGYSVATYVLGIGDRHNDNIMVTTSGNLFHIDFGHFLGHIKHFMGFKREWAPFVLTPDFIYVMGGERSVTFETYKNLCCRAFFSLRRHANLIINLFSMMRSTGIPELSCVEDTDYIRMVLSLDKQEHEAVRHFRQKVIKKCLDLGWTVQVMWWLHLRKHYS